MTDKEKYLLLAGLAPAGLAYWYFGVHAPGAATLAVQPAIPTAALPQISTAPAVGTSAIPPVGTSSTTTGQDVTELNALLAWAQKTQNPALYAQMVNALTPAQLDGLYNILITQWAGVAPATVAQVAFWNNLRLQYPFLNTGGVGCTNFACTS